MKHLNEGISLTDRLKIGWYKLCRKPVISIYNGHSSLNCRVEVTPTTWALRQSESMQPTTVYIVLPKTTLTIFLPNVKVQGDEAGYYHIVYCTTQNGIRCVAREDNLTNCTQRKQVVHAYELELTRVHFSPEYRDEFYDELCE